MGTILLFIIVLSLLVFVHELGHFLMARKMGMKVEEFGFGFPPRLWGIKRGKTIYSINWIPLGGFVKIKGESGEHAHDKDSFSAKKAWQRLVVLVAGVVMNIFLAAVLLSIGFMIGLPSVIDDTLPANAVVSEEALLITQVIEGSSADVAGVLSGDKLVSVDGIAFSSDAEARDYIGANGADGIDVVVEARGEEQRSYTLTSEYIEEAEAEAVGVGLLSTGRVSYPFFSAILQGTSAAAQLTWQVVKAFYDLIGSLITGQGPGVELSGPVGIAVMTGEVAALGFVYLIQFTAILSINLAIINIFPFPALDGGRILFLAIEKLRGKPVNERVEAAVHNLGFMLLMLLIVLVTYKDFVTFGDEIFGAIKNIL